jgi:hypothetical protein
MELTISYEFDSLPRNNVIAREIALAGASRENQPALASLMARHADLNKKWPRYSAINCWHTNEHESAAMWKLCLKSDEEIAVQSTYEKVRDSL